VDDFILALGWVGVYAPLALGAVGSMVGVGRGGMAACGALLEVESGYGRFIGVSAMPSSQTIYGIVVMLTLNVGVTVENAPGIFEEQAGSVRYLDCACGGGGGLRGIRLRLRPGTGGIRSRNGRLNMASETQQASGVQELISRIRDDGVQAGQDKADEIVAQARQEAARLVSEARAEADEIQRKTAASIDSDRQAALEALKMAARDTRLQLASEVVAAFEQQVKRLVAPVTYDGTFIRTLILVLAGQAAEQYPVDQELQVLVSDLIAGRDHENEALDERARESVLGIASDMLREGIEIIPDSEISGGARVRVVGEDLEIDLTDEAISKLLLKHLLPRYRAILEGVE
jgi:V/A-type H+-transporting ATPase subunit E